MDDNDLHLIRLAKRGDTDAFEMMVRNYQDFVYRTAYGVTQHHADAKDVTQETFLKVYLSIRKLKEDRTFPSWIARIAVRTALDLLSKQRRHGPDADVSLVESGAWESASADIRMDLERGMKALGPEHRTVLVLREILGFDYEEIANILDIPVGTVRSRLHNGRLQLRRELLGREGG